MILIINYVPAFPLMANTPLQNKAKSYVDCFFLSNNTFLIATNDNDTEIETIKKVRNDFAEDCSYGDRLFVGQFGKFAGWIGYNGDKLTNWLSKNIDITKQAKDVFNPQCLSSQNGEVNVPPDMGMKNDMTGDEISALIENAEK